MGTTYKRCIRLGEKSGEPRYFHEAKKLQMLKHNSMMFASRKPLTAITSGNPNFGVALRKLRLSQQSMLLEFGGLINAMHIHYIEKLPT